MNTPFFIAGMFLVNCSVLCQTSNKLIYPWKIVTVENSGSTVSQFYEHVVLNDLQNVEPGSLELSAAFIGRSKESMDAVALSVPMSMAIQSFGAFLRDNVNEIPIALPQPRNALEGLMSSQKQLAHSLHASIQETRKISFIMTC